LNDLSKATYEDSINDWTGLEINGIYIRTSENISARGIMKMQE
jgi:hypothetical protein